MRSSIRVFIVAENRLLRETLARACDKQRDMTVVGQARLWTEALEALQRTHADILLLSPIPPALPELDALEKIRSRSPESRIVLLGMEEDEKLFLTAVRRGVVGYLGQDASASDIVAAVRSAAQGEAVCPPRLCLFLFNYMAKEATGVAELRLQIQLGLTRREHELLPMIARGLTNKEIAGRLNVSEQTVKNHVHRMIHKAGASSRLDVVQRCRLSEFAR